MHYDLRVLAEAMSAAVLGQQRLVGRLLIALLADGHLLVEGAPGLAKTTAVKALASRIEADFQRIQFTPDLLPADLTGTEIWQQAESQFAFQARSEEHTSELQSLMRISYAVFCLKKKTNKNRTSKRKKTQN